MRIFVERILRGAGKLILNSSKNIVSKKDGVGNFVLQADLISEKYILESIKKRYPSHKVLSEENTDRIDNPENEKGLWIVDPLDGTTNAKNNIPFFSVSIAYVENGIVKVGGVYDPNRDELFLAKKGEGAYCNGIKISVKNETELKDLIVNIGSPYSTENFRLTYPMEKVFYEKGARMVNFGSAALEGVWVASGRLGAYFEAGLKPWDIAAVQLIVSEAGGRMVDPYNVGNFSVFNQKAVVIGNEKIVKKILKFW